VAHFDSSPSPRAAGFGAGLYEGEWGVTFSSFKEGVYFSLSLFTEVLLQAAAAAAAAAVQLQD
jgi:hypothetical protein